MQLSEPFIRPAMYMFHTHAAGQQAGVMKGVSMLGTPEDEKYVEKVFKEARVGRGGIFRYRVKKVWKWEKWRTYPQKLNFLKQHF